MLDLEYSDDLIIELEGLDASEEEDLGLDQNSFNTNGSKKTSVRDPVGLYLQQMAETPLLTKEEEKDIATNIEIKRDRFLEYLISSTFIAKKTLKTLTLVQNKKLRLDRTLEVATNDSKLKESCKNRIGPNIETITEIFKEVNSLRSKLENLDLSSKDKKELRKEIKRKTSHIYYLFKDTYIRPEIIIGHFKDLADFMERKESLTRTLSLNNENRPLGKLYKSMTLRKLEAVNKNCSLSLEEFKAFNEKAINLKKDLDQSRKELVGANLRLVVSIAKKYRNQGLSFLDLIQEGNKGLMRAVDKFKVSKGYRLSTYATRWIRQAIGRAVSEKTRTIRVPVHIAELLKKFKAAKISLTSELGKEPSYEQLAKKMKLKLEVVENLNCISKNPVAFDRGRYEDDNPLIDLIPESSSRLTPEESLEKKLLRSIIDEELDYLSEREKDIIKMRFGIDCEDSFTLKEVGEIYGVTKERVRQIESKALKKIPRSRLKGFFPEDRSLCHNASKNLI